MKFLIIFFIILFYCSTELEFMAEGTIIGLDHSLCGCCGGWFIDIDSDTSRFYEVPKK